MMGISTANGQVFIFELQYKILFVFRTALKCSTLCSITVKSFCCSGEQCSGGRLVLCRTRCTLSMNEPHALFSFLH